jgi:hypothetical protein
MNIYYFLLRTCSASHNVVYYRVFYFTVLIRPTNMLHCGITPKCL